VRMTGVMKTALRRTSLRVVSANSRGFSIAFQILLQKSAVETLLTTIERSDGSGQ
jgi:hypothetical protein